MAEIKRVDILEVTEHVQRAMMGDVGATWDLVFFDVPLLLPYVRALEGGADVLGEFLDEDACRYDHNAYCQTHYSEQPCRMQRAREALARIEAQRRS